MDWVPINWRIVNNPLNWAKVLLMAFLAFVAFNLVMNAIHPNEDIS